MADIILLPSSTQQDLRCSEILPITAFHILQGIFLPTLSHALAIHLGDATVMNQCPLLATKPGLSHAEISALQFFMLVGF